MNPMRTATMLVVGAAAAALVAGAATSNRDVPPPPVVVPVPIDARGADLAREISRLHERLQPDATPRQPGRNLFSFRATPKRAMPTVAEPRAALTEKPAPLAEPALRLAGIAEDAGPDGPVRTAFISGEGQLFMVREGENVTLRYRVTKISTDVVELTDVGDGTIRRLAMKP
jgi:hypothetical protein